MKTNLASILLISCVCFHILKYMVIIVGVSFPVSKRGGNFCYRNELWRLDASQLLIIVFTVKPRQSLGIFSGPQILYLKWKGSNYFRNYFHSTVNEVEGVSHSLYACCKTGIQYPLQSQRQKWVIWPNPKPISQQVLLLRWYIIWERVDIFEQLSYL